MTTLALWLLPVAALACWRGSKLVASALAAALGAWLLYRHAWQWEGLRWVSAATGLVGALELGRRATARIRIARVRLRSCRTLDEIALATPALNAEYARRNLWGRADALALLLVGSSAADAAALLWWRGTGEWGPQPFFQVVVLAAMIAIGLWPRRRT